MHINSSHIGMNSSVFVAHTCPLSLHLNVCEYYYLHLFIKKRLTELLCSFSAFPWLIQIQAFRHVSCSVRSHWGISGGQLCGMHVLVKHSSTSVCQIHSCHYFRSCLGFSCSVSGSFWIPYINPNFCVSSLFVISWQCLSTTQCGSLRNSGWPWTKASGWAP